jgi:hypothetical protein
MWQFQKLLQIVERNKDTAVLESEFIRVNCGRFLLLLFLQLIEQLADFGEVGL